MTDTSIVLPPQARTIQATDGGMAGRLGPAMRARNIPIINGDGAPGVVIDVGGIEVGDDGSVNLPMPAVHTHRGDEDDQFGENLAERLPKEALAAIGSEVIEGSDADEQSRTKWINQYNQGIDLLGTTIEELSNQSTRREISRANDSTLIEAMVKYQAALALDTPVVTPDGWTTIGDIRAGDYVIDERGEPVRVVDTSPIYNDNPCFRVRFDDGFWIIADADHLWSTEEKSGRNSIGWIWKDKSIHTKDLVPGQHSIWLSKPFNLPTKDLPVDPYVLGLWLGDGDSSGGAITIGFHDYKQTVDNVLACGYSFRDVHSNGDSCRIALDGLTSSLRVIGVLNNKHIPPEYMRASHQQREALLQGLMDSDGHINKITKQCTFANVDFELLAQTQELLKTVGIKAKILCIPAKTKTFPNGKEYTSQHYYDLRFSVNWDQQIFRLPRKRATQEGWKRKIHLRRTKRFGIIDVEPIRSVPVKCLTIDNESHLFLAGLGMVPTHNSSAAELCPASGPCKVPTIGTSSEQEDQLAKDFEDDFNYLLTEVMTEYYPDTASMLMRQGFCGLGYKKIYRDPIRRRPTSESIMAPDLIVSEEATDLQSARRVTHVIQMIKSQLRRMQITGQYIDIDLGQAQGNITGIGGQARRKIRENEGLIVMAQRPQDQPYGIRECDTDLDIDELGGFDFSFERAAPWGLPLPYKVTVEEGTRQVLSIRRNWRQEDELYIKQNCYVKFGMIPGMGYHNWGFLQLLGNATRNIRSIIRILIAAGMYSNFPGGIKNKNARMSTNEVMPAPGEWPDVDVPPGSDLSKLFFPMPYKGPDAVFVQLLELLKQDAQRLGGTVLLDTGEGRANVPVGTILAVIQQQIQVMAEVQKANHRAQKEELRKIRELFRDDPTLLSLLVRERPRDSNSIVRGWERAEEFMDLNLVPASDPNSPSQIHRVMIANVRVMLAQANPELYDLLEVHRAALQAIGDSPDRFLKRPDQMQAPAPDPKAQAALLKAENDQQKNIIDAQTSADKNQVEREKIAAQGAQSVAQNITDRQVSQNKAQTEVVKAGLDHHADMTQAGLDHHADMADIAAKAQPQVTGIGGGPMSTP